ncbi:hypothetical protein LEP1GSC108_1267 [Leptospira weilii str. UI 13098]|uniref:Uncharacterized protein n=2 Tax=Leptospira weilii TaxID=28184 RepID=M6QIH0_9LEPT|nr:hypothetical protein LEP1GSC108_1267 [Leptospira weilii str. UI 13098]
MNFNSILSRRFEIKDHFAFHIFVRLQPITMVINRCLKFIGNCLRDETASSVQESKKEKDLLLLIPIK